MSAITVIRNSHDYRRRADSPLPRLDHRRRPKLVVFRQKRLLDLGSRPPRPPPEDSLVATERPRALPLGGRAPRAVRGSCARAELRLPGLQDGRDFSRRSHKRAYSAAPARESSAVSPVTSTIATTGDAGCPENCDGEQRISLVWKRLFRSGVAEHCRRTIRTSRALSAYGSPDAERSGLDQEVTALDLERGKPPPVRRFYLPPVNVGRGRTKERWLGDSDVGAGAGSSSRARRGSPEHGLSLAARQRPPTEQTQPQHSRRRRRRRKEDGQPGGARLETEDFQPDRTLGTLTPPQRTIRAPPDAPLARSLVWSHVHAYATARNEAPSEVALALGRQGRVTTMEATVDGTVIRNVYCSVRGRPLAPTASTRKARHAKKCTRVTFCASPPPIFRSAAPAGCERRLQKPRRRSFAPRNASGDTQRAKTTRHPSKAGRCRLPAPPIPRRARRLGPPKQRARSRRRRGSAGPSCRRIWRRRGGPPTPRGSGGCGRAGPRSSEGSTPSAPGSAGPECRRRRGPAGGPASESGGRGRRRSRGAPRRPATGSGERGRLPSAPRLGKHPSGGRPERLLPGPVPREIPRARRCRASSRPCRS
jgi:hypothetical protein